ncbi:hypothetical protein KAI04_01830 [Candidatus Pacearchaeota archaeon]|nr:hypothetical protein [Candidatus Pacearchaeota archaeon]
MKQIFEIFAKSPKKNIQKPKPKIIVDYREKNSLIISELIKLGIEIEFKELKVADYIVKDVAIERKTINDFVNSMINKRLFNQIQELQQYKNRLLLIEGINEQELYSDDKSGVNGNAIRGFLLSILLKYNIPIIFTKDYEDSAKFISVLSKKQSKELALKAKKRILNKKEQLQFIIEGFPGIGPKTAQKLLKKYKTIQNIINTSEKELKETIGKKAEVISKIVEMNY